MVESKGLLYAAAAGKQYSGTFIPHASCACELRLPLSFYLMQPDIFIPMRRREKEYSLLHDIPLHKASLYALLNLLYEKQRVFGTYCLLNCHLSKSG